MNDADTGTTSHTQQKEHIASSSGPKDCAPTLETDIAAFLPFIREDCIAKKFHHQLRTLSCRHGVPVQGFSPNPTPRNGQNTVVNGKLV